MSGEVAVNFVIFVLVKRFSGGNCWSPIRRFGHRFVTSIARSFDPARAAAPSATSKGFFHSTPSGLPFHHTSAISRTSPRSSHNSRLYGGRREKPEGVSIQ